MEGLYCGAVTAIQTFRKVLTEELRPPTSTLELVLQCLPVSWANVTNGMTYADCEQWICHENADWVLKPLSYNCELDVDCAFDVICESRGMMYTSWSIKNYSHYSKSLVYLAWFQRQVGTHRSRYIVGAPCSFGSSARSLCGKRL